MTEIIKFIKENKRIEALNIKIPEEKWDKIIKSLEREIPKKPKNHCNEYIGNKLESSRKQCECGNWIDSVDSYCSFCGQRLE